MSYKSLRTAGYDVKYLTSWSKWVWVLESLEIAIDYALMGIGTVPIRNYVRLYKSLVVHGEESSHKDIWDSAAKAPSKQSC